jgi:transposase
MLGGFKLAKAFATKSRAQAINQLKAVLIFADPRLGESLAGLSNPRLIRACAALAVDTPADVVAPPSPCCGCRPAGSCT